MIYVLYFVHVVVCLFLIMVVLLQQGKGADLSVFGGGATQTVFGARGATTLLHKLTVSSFVIFIVTTLAIAVMQQHSDRSSVMKSVAKKAGATKTVPAPKPAPLAPAPVSVPVKPAAPAPPPR
ncbi:MAG TPA: preprotein translocase subunit SecG [Thermoanaerobaculia bacterium]|nr:preprotein translocase subunit SecG [Thermoanaerobaculia bacterium]